MIYVFKTSVQTSMQVQQLKRHIDQALPTAKWNFDLDDVDHILRIDSEEDIVMRIIDLLNTQQYSCEELV